ncbi:hypothetical protein FHP25_14800 [Vineibacter terrae]|uniref:DUF4149 domain-containing protein n=1 Tax=Vineibacter terrae TaxID=2586908 RepID=A0A5C8PLR6_9HYPH|nr:hypothetical protein [Vineibacter terrae]TXL75149.1 hypothetical protein FHP25_14800 [Vineibacter terrae]
MVPDIAAFYAVIILMFPMAYFMFASVAFLFVSLDIPEVAQLLRGLLNVYFQMVMIAGVIAAAAFAATARPLFAVFMCLIASLSIVARRWFLQRMDADRGAREAGDRNAIRQFRRLHWGAMAGNVVQLAAVMASVPFIA